jgi:predicted nuclease with TOPRIM domain
MRARLQTALEEKAALSDRADRLENECARLQEQVASARLDKSTSSKVQDDSDLQSTLDQVMAHLI